MRAFRVRRHAGSVGDLRADASSDYASSDDHIHDGVN